MAEIENKNTFFCIRNFYALNTPYTHKNRYFEYRSGANIYNNRFLTVAIDFLVHNVPSSSIPGPKLKIRIDFTGLGIFTPTLHPQKPNFRGGKRIQYLPNFDFDTGNQFFGAQCTRVECRPAEIENKNIFFRNMNFYAHNTPYTTKTVLSRTEAGPIFTTIVF